MIWGWKAAVEITEPIPNPVKSKHGVSATFEQTARGFHFPHSGKKKFPCIFICAHYEDDGKKSSFKKWGQLIQKLQR